MATRSKRLKVPLDYLLRIGARDKWTCHICGLGFKILDPWEVEHDTSLARGGTNHMSNMRLGHRSCNNEKGTA